MRRRVRRSSLWGCCCLRERCIIHSREPGRATSDRQIERLGSSSRTLPCTNPPLCCCCVSRLIHQRAAVFSAGRLFFSPVNATAHTAQSPRRPDPSARRRFQLHLVQVPFSLVFWFPLLFVFLTLQLPTKRRRSCPSRHTRRPPC